MGFKMRKIYICYRHSENKIHTEKIYTELSANFGSKNIFRDSNNIRAGQKFTEVLIEELAVCRVMIVIIGPNWTPNRLRDAEDWVREEIFIGLQRNSVTVIPVLLDKTQMPTTEDIPPELHPLISQKAIPIRTNTRHFLPDMDALVARIHEIIEDNPTINGLREISLVGEQVTSEISQKIDDLEKKIENLKTQSSSLRLIRDRRSGFDEFFSWITSNDKRLNLFFAGRSVLHRIEDDLTDRNWKPIEDVIINKLKDGANITILFLDPRSDLIYRIEESQGEYVEQVLSDITRSIRICQRLYKRLRNEHSFGRTANLDIRIYDQIPYFSYHKDNKKVYLGFYLAAGLRNDSAVFKVKGEGTKKFFGDHIAQIFGKAEPLVQLSGNTRPPVFNDRLLKNIYKKLSEVLGQDKAAELLPIDPDIDSQSNI